MLAYRIPNLFRRLVGEGAMTAAFIPTLTHYMVADDKDEWKRFAGQAFALLALVLLAIVAAGVLFSPWIVRALTLGSGSVDAALTAELNRIVWPYLLFIGLSALAIGILNALRIFALPALSPVALNLTIIGFSFVAFKFQQPAIALGLGVLLGGIIQLVLQLPTLWKRGIRPKLAGSFHHPGIRRVAKLLVPGILGAGVVQINFAVNTVFATHPLMPRGSLMSLQIADRVTELVLGGYALAIATVILPMMSQQVAERNIDELKHTISFSLRLVSFITIPATVGLIILRQPIIQVLFQHGRFDRLSTEITAWALLFAASGLPWYAGTKILVPAFYSTHDTVTPVKVSVLVMTANVLLNLVFLEPLRNGGPPAAAALAGMLNFLLLYLVFRNRYGGFGGWELARSVTRVAIASGIMGLGCWLMLAFSRFRNPALIGRNPGIWDAGVLFGMLAAAALLFFAVARVLGCSELNDIYGIARLRRIVGRSAPSAGMP